MSEPFTLIQLLAELADLEVVVRRCEVDLAVAVVEVTGGRRLLLVERTYRSGIGVILDPTNEQVEIAREGDLWKLWNSERRQLLDSAI